MAPKGIPTGPSKDHTQGRLATPGFQASRNDHFPLPARQSTGSSWSSLSPNKKFDVPGRRSSTPVAGPVTAKATRKVLVDKYAPRNKAYSGYTPPGMHFANTSSDLNPSIKGPPKAKAVAHTSASQRKHITSSSIPIRTTSRIPAPIVPNPKFTTRSRPRRKPQERPVMDSVMIPKKFIEAKTWYCCHCAESDQAKIQKMKQPYCQNKRSDGERCEHVICDTCSTTPFRKMQTRSGQDNVMSNSRTVV